MKHLTDLKFTFECDKRSIVYSQSLRASRLCSWKEDFVKYSEKMKNGSSKWGYPDKVIKNEMKNSGESKS